MNRNPRKNHNKIEITDLIAEAVSNATERRNEASDLEASLSDLSDEQAKFHSGGFGVNTLRKLFDFHKGIRVLSTTGIRHTTPTVLSTTGMMPTTTGMMPTTPIASKGLF